MDAETKHFNKTFIDMNKWKKIRINFILMVFIREEINEDKNESHQGLWSDDIILGIIEVREVR